MIERVLLAVDGSPDSLAAARLAIELAGALHARLRVVYVHANHEFDLALEKATAHVRPAEPDAAILQRVSKFATAAGLANETETLTGHVGPAILDAAREWPADLVVIGNSSRPTSGQPYVGSQTRHVLEFADQPVLVATARHP